MFFEVGPDWSTPAFAHLHVDFLLPTKRRVPQNVADERDVTVEVLFSRGKFHKQGQLLLFPWHRRPTRL